MHRCSWQWGNKKHFKIKSSQTVKVIKLKTGSGAALTLVITSK